MSLLRKIASFFSKGDKADDSSETGSDVPDLGPLPDPDVTRAEFYKAAQLDNVPPFARIDGEYIDIYQKLERYVNLCESPAGKHNVDFQKRLGKPFSRFKKCYSRFAILWSLVKGVDEKMKGGLDEITRKALEKNPGFKRFLSYLENFVVQRTFDDTESRKLMFLCDRIGSQFDGITDAKPDPRTVPKYIFTVRIVEELEKFLNDWTKTLENDQAFPEGKPEKEIFLKPEDLEREINKSIGDIAKAKSDKLVLRLAPPFSREDLRQLTLVFDEFGAGSKILRIGHFEFGGNRIEHEFTRVNSSYGNLGSRVKKSYYGNVTRFECGLIVNAHSPCLQMDKEKQSWKQKFSVSFSGEVYNTVVYSSSSIYLNYDPAAGKIFIEEYSSMDDST